MTEETKNPTFHLSYHKLLVVYNGNGLYSTDDCKELDTCRIDFFAKAPHTQGFQIFYKDIPLSIRVYCEDISELPEEKLNQISEEYFRKTIPLISFDIFVEWLKMIEQHSAEKATTDLKNNICDMLGARR